jgi:hypothetical protein
VTALVLLALLSVLGACAVGRLRLSGPVLRAVCGLTAAMYLARILQGPGFVPGLVAVAPIIPAGVVATIGRRSVGGRARVLVLAGLLSLPPIWYLQWQGNHIAQWGGRYILVPGALLTVAGLVALDRARVDRRIPAAFAAAALVLSAYGAVWHVQRTRVVADAIRSVEAVPDDVVIASTDLDLFREGASYYGAHRWVTSADPIAIIGAGGVAEHFDIPRVDVIQVVDPSARPTPIPAVPSYRATGTRTIEWLDSELLVTTYEHT